MEKTPYTAVRRFVMITMILVPAIPFLLVMGIGYHHFARAVESGSLAAMKRIAFDHREMISVFLEERASDLRMIVNTVGFQALTQPQRLSAVFTHLQNASSAFSDLGVFDAEGNHLAYHGPFDLTGKQYREAPWFKETLANGAYISDVFLGFRNSPHFIIAVAGSRAGRPWVLRATVDSQRFDTLVRQVRMGKTGEAYLLNRAGILQTNRRSGGDLMERPAEAFPQTPEGTAIHTRSDTSKAGEAFIYATAWLNNGQWLLVVRQETADAFRHLRATWLPVIGISLLGAAGIVLAAVTLSAAVVRRMQDVDSEKALLNQQLIGASRLAELGEMAAGFAHEINNPLQVMTAEMALIRTLQEELVAAGQLEKGDDYAQIKDSMAQVGTQIDRCAKITRAILKFGRQDDVHLEALPLDKAVPEIIAMVEQKAQVNGIQIHSRLPESATRVLADPSQFQQVLLNLLNNAIDAIIEKNGSRGGTIQVQVENEDRQKAVIRVRDDGSGVSPENMAKVFSPFFTTKPVGKGTGLGLSVCHSIVEQMGGQLMVSSDMGLGTEFTIVLPIAEGQ